MEDNYLVVIVAALQDPENGITLHTEVKKKRERKVFDGTQLISTISNFGLSDKAKGIEIGQRLLDGGMIKSSAPGEDFLPGKTYAFGDRILMDRQYIVDQLPTAIAYFAQNPYRRPATAKTPEKGRSIFTRLKNLIEREEPPADPTTEEELEGEAKMQVYNPALSLHTVSALDPELIEEDTDEIMFMISSDDPFPLVKAATINKLVERLTFEKFIDIRFQSKFLLTFRAFMTPADLFEALLRRFRVVPEDGSPRGMEEHEYLKRKKVVQLRVITVVSRWVQDYYEDFLDPQQRAKLVAFIEQDVAPPFPSVANGMKLGLAQRQEQHERRRKPLSESIIASVSANFNPDNLSIAELATQLTLYDFDLFVAIPPTQWVALQFSQPGKELRAREILRSISNFNRISKWVGADILRRIQVKSRAAALSRFVNLAGRLRDMHSYNMAMAVFSALNSAPIRRLTATWAEMSPDAALKFKDLEEVFTYTHSYKAYRAALRKSPAPCIPYLGLYLTELTFLEEANPAEIYGLINFQKQALVARVVEEIQFYQRFPYRQVPDPAALAWLQLAALPQLSEEECWSLSLRVEPRNAMESLEKVLMEEERLRQQVKQLEVRISDLEKENGGLKQHLSALDSHLRANIRLTSSGSQPPRVQRPLASVPGLNANPTSPLAGSLLTRENHARSLAGRVAPKVQDTLRRSGRRVGVPTSSNHTPSFPAPLTPLITPSPSAELAQQLRESGRQAVVNRTMTPNRDSSDGFAFTQSAPLPSPLQRSPRNSGVIPASVLAAIPRPPSPLPPGVVLPPASAAPPPTSKSPRGVPQSSGSSPSEGSTRSGLSGSTRAVVVVVKGQERPKLDAISLPAPQVAQPPGSPSQLDESPQPNVQKR